MSVPTEQDMDRLAIYLTERDMDRLTNYKWRYSLETAGFSTEQANRLLFTRWLYRRGGILGDTGSDEGFILLARAIVGAAA
jgi:hypothetical protein